MEPGGAKKYPKVVGNDPRVTGSDPKVMGSDHWTPKSFLGRRGDPQSDGDKALDTRILHGVEGNDPKMVGNDPKVVGNDPKVTGSNPWTPESFLEQSGDSQNDGERSQNDEEQALDTRIPLG